MKTTLKKIKINLLFILISSSILLSSCDSLVTALDYTNQGLGGECLETTCSAGYYNSNTGKYAMNAYLVKNDQGEDITYYESNWLDVRANEALDYGIGIYYFTSPYSNAEYKFVVTCSQWR